MRSWVPVRLLHELRSATDVARQAASLVPFPGQAIPSERVGLRAVQAVGHPDRAMLPEIAGQGQARFADAGRYG
jgi:hypothetical protein